MMGKVAVKVPKLDIVDLKRRMANNELAEILPASQFFLFIFGTNIKN